jgi:hypothetical protein
VVTPPPASVSPPPPAPRVAPKPKPKVERPKPAARPKAKPDRRPVEDASGPVAVSPAPAPILAPKGSDLTTSPLIRFLLVATALLAVLSISLAALPLAALERVLSSETHWRSEQVTMFVEGHRLDIAVAGIAMLLVALVVAIPTVAG